MKKYIYLLIGKERTCPWWLCFVFDNPLRKLFHNPYKILGKYVNKGDVVLDFGAGMGYFTIALCNIVGDRGIVYAVDIQKEMLNRIEAKAKKRNITYLNTLLIKDDGLNIDVNFDFILAFWMVHEIYDKEKVLKELYERLKTSGKMLVVEPKLHVSKRTFENEVEILKRIGFDVLEYPSVRLSYAVLVTKLPCI